MTPKNRTKKKNFLEGLFLQNYPAQSRFAEAFRSLRTNLHFSFSEGEIQSILVSSAGPEEGKSTVSANLAYTLAQSDKRVLLIDADMRKPKVSQLIPPSKIGLSFLLSNVFEINIDSGALTEFGTSDLLWLAGFQKKTGALCLTENDEKVNIYIKKGKLFDVHWLTRPEEKRLANLLIKNQILTAEQIEDAISHQKNTRQQLGFILLSMGYVKEDDLSGFIRIHIIESLQTALRMKSGTFFFEKLPLSHYEKPSYSPPDLPALLQRVIIGEEDIPYLQAMTYGSIKKTETENLFIMPCGPIPKNPGELLSTQQMSFFISFLKRRFDFLVFDTPPIIPASDALILAPFVDGVLLVAKAGKTNRQLVKKAVDQVKSSRANLLGVVLNQLDFKREGYYKYYTEYYGKTE